MANWWWAFVSLLSLVSCAVNLPPQRAKKNTKAAAAISAGPNSEIFDQLIDHGNPALGTFQQRYWVNTEFWKGPGSPVVLFNPGEVPALGSNGDFTFYLTNLALTGQYAEAVGGAVIVIEHRYWGKSSPYTNLTSANLKYLTVEQSAHDMINFAKTAKLQFDTSGNSNADKAPWIFVGGSYSGSLVAWTEIIAPGTFWASHASSAPVQAITDFWQYFSPIQDGMPPVCRMILETLVDYIDSVLTTGSMADKRSLKSQFGMSIVNHDSDFASVISLPLELWQTGEPNFQPFCDAIAGTSSSVGLGLPGYSRYVNIHYACSSIDCYDTYNPKSQSFTNTMLDPNTFGGRAWDWMLCNEAFGWWQTGAPKTQKSIVSRLVTADYYQRQCTLQFPGVQFAMTADEHNTKYMGWNVQNTTRLMFSSGQFDPWRSAGVSSVYRPGGPMQSTPQIPVFIGEDGNHCQDLYMNGPTPAILSLRLQEIAQIKTWVDEYYHTSPTQTSTSAPPSSTATSLPVSTSSATTSTTSTTPPSMSSASPSTPIPTLSTATPTTPQPSTDPPRSTSATTLSTRTSDAFTIPSFTYIQPTRSVVVN